MSPTHIYGIFEKELHCTAQHDNPFRECRPIVEFTAPSGHSYFIRPFWDGGHTWRMRFSPDEVGLWKWQFDHACRGDFHLDGSDPTFTVTPYDGDNPLYRHGPMQVLQDGRRLVHADETPFFWLADTAWNGVIRGDDDKWEDYLEHRLRQRFTAIQFVCSHWRGDSLDPAGEAACTEEHPIRVNPGFFQRIDRRVAMINEKGLLAAPVMIWSLLETDLGFKLPEEDAALLSEYIEARYGAHQLLWLFGGDGDYRKMGFDRWKRMGRQVFQYGHPRLATLHPCGQTWPCEAFRKEKWYHIAGYQSGHGDGEDHLEWLAKGPPATQWDNKPPLPVINLEPNYETAFGYQHHTQFTDREVRRGVWWSLLVSPTAGVTYGHDSIWNWNFETGPSEGHGEWHEGAVPPWYEGLETPGIHSMTNMRKILDKLDWTSLVPCPEIIKAQPGDNDIHKQVVASETADGKVVLYAPEGGEIVFKKPANLPAKYKVINPATGEEKETLTLDDDTIQLDENHDWLLISE
ncbi:MAG: DUF4038 domain-containing protein [Candidatus Sumerlaeota bacterium]